MSGKDCYCSPTNGKVLSLFRRVMFNFKDKIVVVMRGTRRIGLEIVRKFAETRASVFVGARQNSEGLKRVEGEIAFQQTDVRSLSDLRRLVSLASKSLEYIDIFINNAAFYSIRPIHNIDEEFVDKIIRTNLIGCIWGCKAAAGKMSEGVSSSTLRVCPGNAVAKTILCIPPRSLEL